MFNIWQKRNVYNLMREQRVDLECVPFDVRNACEYYFILIISNQILSKDKILLPCAANAK